MPIWLQLAQGPLMRFILAVLVFGLLRLLCLTIWDIAAAVRQAKDRQIPYSKVILNTLGWLIPINRIHKTRHLYSLASFGFHLGILTAGIFLSNHIHILQSVTGISWISLPKPLLDVLVVLMVVCGSYIMGFRIYVHSSRALSKGMDYVLLALLLGIFISGFVAGQEWNPIPYDALMLSHTLLGGGLLLVIPFTKISHCILFPLIRLGSEVAWHFPAQSAREVNQALRGTEGRKI